MSGCSKLRGSMEPESHSAPMLIIRGNWNLLSSGWPLFSGQNFQPERIVNFMPLEHLRNWIQSVRDRSVAKNKSK